MQDQPIVTVDENARDAIQKIADAGRRVEIIGQFRNGKLELVPESIDEMRRKWPDGEFVFVAVNAPFDPVPTY